MAIRSFACTRHMKRICIALMFVFVSVTALLGQEELKDSLTQVLRNLPEDTVRVMTLISLGQLYEGNAPDSAIHYYEESLWLSEKLNYTRGVINYYTNVTFVYNLLGRADTSLLLNLKALEIARGFGDRNRLAACLNNLGSSYFNLLVYDSATKYYLQAAEVLKAMGDTLRLTVLYSNLTGLFKDTGDYERSLHYGAKALDLARAWNERLNIIIAINNYSLPLINTRQFDKVIPLLQEGIALCRETDNRSAMSSLLINLGDAYIKSGQFAQAKKAYEEGLGLAESIQDLSGVCFNLRGLSLYYLHTKNWQQALAYVNRSQGLALSHNFQDHLVENYLQLSDLALATGDMQGYRTYRFRSDSITQSMNQVRFEKNLHQQEQYYQARIREQQIEKLTQEKELKALQYRNRLYLFGSALLLVISAWVVLFIRSRQKRLLLEGEAALQEKRIHQLETEKQLLASEAVLKGQEEERRRLAKDLHDGLGGMLSGIKFSFSHMKENLIMTPENQQEFARSMDMLDSSISELRRVAHNMMPESLLRYGLDASLKDFCKSITASGQIRITYQSFDLERLQLEQRTSVTIYRIVLELINNILKHAAAQTALVQLIYANDKLTIIVEDDGMGFDTSSISAGKGMGWTNIRSRVEYLKGRYEIQSQPGKGTTVSIEFQV